MENSLLATFLYADDLGCDKNELFKLNDKIFTSEFRRAVANKINDELDSDKMIGFLLVTIEGHTKGTKYEQDLADIMSQTPLPISVSSRMHSTLENEYKERIAKAFR